MNQDQISVIIPAYNSCKTIVQAVESVLGQTFKAMEIIVIDDGSTDNLNELLFDYINQNKIIYLRQDNQGTAVARNNGMKVAKGEFVAFLDADDYWHEQKLEKQIGVFKNNSSCILCYTEAYLVLPNQGKVENVVRGFFDTPRTGKVLISLVFHNFITLSSVMVRLSDVMKVGGFTEKRSLMTSEDYYLWLKLAPLGNFCFIEKPLIFYRKRDSLSKIDKKINHKRVASVFRACLKSSKFLDSIGYVFGWFMYSIKYYFYKLTY